ncbi:hypothetical protein P3T76_008406 [Phytophthora citrophthora]|uniref:Uncharacterized protein n=1 Tax=Phytophthora citrophthora TaxID=4793 RepID=A0AAD9GKU7_9STRA|nr:hypothetical protein P3T76_008406 [Phytophthora citrophthora]
MYFVPLLSFVSIYLVTMASLDTLALYERILAHVRPQELHRSSNIILKEQYSTLAKVVDDAVATFAKVEEVRDAVNQLEQGKPSAGRSDSLLQVMDSTMQLQQKLEKNLEKVAAKMKVKDLEVEEKKQKRKREEDKKEKTAESSSSESSSDSSSDSSSSREEEGISKKKKQVVERKANGSGEEKTKNSDLALAQEALKTIRSVKVFKRSVEDHVQYQWVKALFNIKQILNRQAGCDARTTDKAPVEVVASALEASVGVFRKIEWTAEYVKQMKSLIAVLSDACSKNEVLRVFFHRARAGLESLEMSVPAKLQSSTESSAITKPAATGISLECLLRTYLKLSHKIHSLSPTTKPTRILEALGLIQQVMADDFICVHSDAVLASVTDVRRWITEAPLQDDTAKSYRLYASNIAAYGKKFPDKQKQREWRKLSTGVRALLDVVKTKVRHSSQPVVSKAPSWSKATEAKVGVLMSVLAQLKQWQDGIFSLDQLDKELKKLNDVIAYRSSDWEPLSDPSTIDCLDKLTTCIELIKKKEHRAKRLKTVNKWKAKCLNRQ